MVEVQNLTKEYPGHPVVKNLTFTLRPHQVTGLLGVNGAGKTTTMRMLAGFLKPTAGSIRIAGLDLYAEPMKARANIGYLPEVPPLYPDLTVTEHLRFVCDLRQIPSAERDAETDRVLRALSVTDMKGRLIAHLSKGYKQRVGFAAALVGHPRFLILDEPTSGMDPAQVAQLRLLLETLRQEDTAILISSHILSEITSVCTHLLFLRDGTLAAAGTREEIEGRYQEGKTLSLCYTGDASSLLPRLRELFDHVEELPPSSGSDAAQTERMLKLHIAGREDLRPAVFRLFAQYAERVTLLSLAEEQLPLEELFLAVSSGEEAA